MHITYRELRKWKSNTIETARRLGYNEKTLDFLDKNVVIILARSKIPEGMWYGWAHYDDKKPTIEVYRKNISCENISTISEELRSKGVPGKTVRMVTTFLRAIPKRTLFKIFNQSGMDHELIGHLYNHFAKKEHGERAAVEVQIEFSKARGGWLFHKLPWKIISYFAPMILYHHKKDEF